MRKFAIDVELSEEHWKWLVEHGVICPSWTEDHPYEYWWTWLQSNREDSILFECIESHTTLRKSAKIVEYNDDWFKAELKIDLRHDAEKVRLIPHNARKTIGDLIDNDDIENLIKFLIAWRSSELWCNGQTYVCQGNEKTTEYHWMPYLSYNYQCTNWTIIALRELLANIIEHSIRDDAITEIMQLAKEGLHF